MDVLSRLVQNLLDLDYIAQVLPTMLGVGLVNTLYLSAISALFSIAVGVVLAVMGLSGRRLLRWPARVYVDVFRGIPAILAIVIIGQGLFWLARDVFNTTSPYPLGILALTLITSAYLAEIFRSGIQSVEKGQMEAARALGFGYGKAMALVVIPQGLRRVLPATVNQFIQLIKLSSLVFYLGLQADQREIFRIAQDFASMTGNQSSLIAAAVCYLVITVPLTHLVNWIDRRLRDGRRVTAPTDDGDDLATAETTLPAGTPIGARA